ncbi:MAG: pyrroline-5-carboxylate reductase [Clostridiales bacterium]|nr:pyrroline-5-carboxylate reductase [Clostridiales bacterium]
MKIAFIGAGNMAGAMIHGIIRNNVVSPKEVTVSAHSVESPRLISLKEELGINITGDNREAADGKDVIVLAVKPVMYETVIQEIRSQVSPETIIISVAPGKSLAWLQENFRKDVRIVRTMPNTPAMVGEGMTGFCVNANITSEDMDKVKAILNAFGVARMVPENLMDAVVGASGSSPAFVFMLIEAMGDACVKAGIKREDAYTFVAQAVLGSAKMVLETGKHPAELKDMVCSPGGTTIEGVMALEAAGFRSAIQEAIEVTIDKCKRV